MAFPASDQHGAIRTINLDEFTSITDTDDSTPPAKRFRPTLEQQLLAARCTSTSHQLAVQSLPSAIGQAVQTSHSRPAILQPSAPSSGRITSITSGTVAHCPPAQAQATTTMANPKRKPKDGKEAAQEAGGPPEGG